MIKEERHERILNLIQNQHFIKVSDIQKELQVADMTVRRDLQELEDKKKLKRVHGGATVVDYIDNSLPLELSHNEKLNLHKEEKNSIAQLIAKQINDGDTIFLGAGTTIELVYNYFNSQQVKIITNSFPIFNKFKNDSRVELILIGGAYRPKTGAFIGTITNDTVASIYVQKAFIGANGILNNQIFDSNADEGVTQKNILLCADKKYIVADHSKLNKKDFYTFYSLSEADYLITDSNISKEDYKKYQKFINILME